MKKNALLTVALLLVSTLLFGQREETDFMRSTGKIYVVVAVIVTIFIGIVLFLIYLDRKLTKLENQINDND
ncbi:MAG: CcmD family protein [Lewinellaceae bacterium]|nr:CcmD family protein [Phaeodactylibacter sp.]MCB0613009.1 CcmD family protein [Phaeodactylibacter sp.]MCB9351784.1 CcmD family protein [Lewinellaceae bacterium]